MPWIMLFIAGLLEVVWAVGLKLSNELSRPLVVSITVLALVLSISLLAVAMRNIPMATAYLVWTGIGAVGTFLLGALWFSEPITPVKAVSLICVIIGLVGLKQG
jgi:quaternary ammonium compound-resistance protein SugE